MVEHAAHTAAVPGAAAVPMALIRAEIATAVAAHGAPVVWVMVEHDFLVCISIYLIKDISK
jgi:hypothetical protein